MKKYINKWLFRNVVLPYMTRNKAQCSEALVDTTVYQLWYAGVGYQHINKWLRVMQHKTIKAYVMTGAKHDAVRLFYDYPDADKRAGIKGNVVLISQ